MIKSRKAATHYKRGDDCDDWFFVQNENQTIILERMPPHTFEKRHYHESSKQFFFIIKGTAEIEIDGLFYSLHEQEGIEVESGLPHQLFNNSETDIEFLVCSTPPTTDDPNTSTLTIIFG